MNLYIIISKEFIVFLLQFIKQKIKKKHIKLFKIAFLMLNQGNFLWA